MGRISLRFNLCYTETLRRHKPRKKHYREKMNKIKTQRKSKTPYAENINTHVLSGWFVHSTFAYEDVLDPLKM